MSKTASKTPPAVPAQHTPAPTVSVGFKARRRRPAMAALGVALIAAGGLGGFLAYQETGHRTPVLAVAQAVQAGDTIKDADLVVASVALDPALKPVPAADRAKIVGKRAAAALVPGSLLTQGQVTDRALVRPGEQLVGIGLKPAQLPASRLSPGDTVFVVSTPSEAARAAQSTGAKTTVPKAPPTVQARVVRVGDKAANTGDVVVDVAVPAANGPSLAAQAATGDVALTLDAGGAS
ncbi:SAF domain-containing protein [Streptomyces sp. NPDC051561]|uniref:SAF domain-containing protein n=1 Tax=Streptomyces sp. NPDC051561 TaxID=3365658 RepID=UPI0037A1ADAF